MPIENIIIIIISILVIVWFFYDYRKYSNRDIYHQKLKRLEELDELIRDIKADIDSNDRYTNMLAKYRGDGKKLANLKKEYRKTALYLRIAEKNMSLFDDFYYHR